MEAFAGHLVLIETLDQIDSTNEEAKRRLEAGAEGEHWLRASMQTAGRGTHGRAWDSPDGAGLYLTRYARHEEPLSPDGLTPMVGIALAEAIRAATGVPVCVKPINDLVCDGFKLGGILVEGTRTPNGMATSIIGIGLNVGSGPRRVRADGWPAASLQDVLPAGQPIPEVSELARLVASRIEDRLADLHRGGPTELHAAWSRVVLDGAPWPQKEPGGR
jgi:BirA family biotin operon repressor/biotin-[acetyl-CoA-carboxylase] ligase